MDSGLHRGRKSWSVASEATTPGRKSIQRKRSVKFAATLLDNLLNEGERAQDCEAADLEAAANPNQFTLTSYKRFAPAKLGKKKFKLCVKRNLFHDDDFRLMDRDGPFCQSNGTWAVSNFASRRVEVDGEDAVEDQTDARSGLYALYFADFYHTFLDAKISLQLLTFAGIYMACFCVFALAFLWSAHDCGLKIEGSFVRAYMLSLETMVTIGYGVSDPYMQGCWQGPVILTTQSLLQMLISACLIGVIFQSLSRPQARANTIIFTNKAVVRTIDGATYLMFRICDLRFQHALIEPHVRCYCAHVHPERGMTMEPLRLMQPDDDFGGSLHPTLPTTVVHRIDGWSPLAPNRVRDARGSRGSRGMSRYSSASASSAASTEERISGVPGPMKNSAVAAARNIAKSGPLIRMKRWPVTAQRQADAETGNRSGCYCPTCGSEFGTLEQLRVHCAYTAVSDEASGFPEEVRHKPLEEESAGGANFEELVSCPEPKRDDIRDHLAEGYFELVVLVEGTEPSTASTLQARHSYVVGGAGNDVAWDCDFVECCSFQNKAGQARRLAVDLGKFHNLVERPYEEEE